MQPMCTQVRPSGKSLRIVWPSSGFKLDSPDLKAHSYVDENMLWRVFALKGEEGTG